MDSITFEMLVWRLSIYAAGAPPSISTALYFAIEAYTTLGYGDVLLPLDWRVMSGLLSTAGLLMFAWSTAIFVTYPQPTLIKASSAHPAPHATRPDMGSRRLLQVSSLLQDAGASRDRTHRPPLGMVHSWSKLT